MSGTNTAQAAEATGEGLAGEAANSEANSAGSTDPQGVTDPQAGGDEGEDNLPEWARERLSKANREAASYRTQLRELQEKTKEYKTVEEFNSAMSELSEKIAAKDRELIAEKYRIDEDMREFIVGTTAEEWEASAKKLSERIAGQKETPPRTETPPAGSRKREPVGSNDSPAEAALRALKRR